MPVAFRRLKLAVQCHGTTSGTAACLAGVDDTIAQLQKSAAAHPGAFMIDDFGRKVRHRDTHRR